MTTNLNDPRLNKRVQADERLDGLFMTEMRCPYCQTKMPKATAKCKNCGLTKDQIYNAELTAPYKPGRDVLFSKVRPASMPYWKMVLSSLFGFFGVHCFLSKRYLRGAIMLLLTVAYFVNLIIFPPMVGDIETNAIRYMFESRTYLFPGDLLGIFALTLWVWDFFAVVFGQYKYPVLPKIEEE